MATAASEDDVRAVADQDLARACKLARQRVAAHPADEDAALLLRDMVRRQAEALQPRSDDAANADPAVTDSLRLMSEGELERAEIELRRHLTAKPDDLTAMVAMAEIAARCDFFDEAQRILAHALDVHPDAVAALLKKAKLQSHVDLLQQRDRGDASLKIIDRVLEIDPDNAEAYALRSSILVLFRRFDESVADYWRHLDLDPLHWFAWANFGTLLSSLGQFGNAVACLRTALALNPRYGMAWWELANLKTSKLLPADFAEMEQLLEDPSIDALNRAQIHFALGKGYGQEKDFERAAGHLDEGNRLKRPLHPHNPDHITDDVSRSAATFTSDYFAQRVGQGCAAPDPIFIVGMPRSGSTLVEQILSSHSAVEGTQELFLILKLALEIDGQKRSESWQETVQGMQTDELEMLGTRFIELARHFRKTDRPFFIDKNPANWRFTGLITSILPNAKIIDVRRNPLDCCFANYSQSFEQGIGYSYSQRDLGHYYADYVRLMRHFDAEVPGRIHRVIYEDLVDDLEKSVRGVVDYLDLPFEESCLRFYETERAVLTPSALQVRKPINRSGIDRWKDYDPWLSDLKESLGSVVGDWRR